jgi:hypothetical protein
MQRAPQLAASANFQPAGLPSLVRWMPKKRPQLGGKLEPIGLGALECRGRPRHDSINPQVGKPFPIWAAVSKIDRPLKHTANNILNCLSPGPD